ncbi:MAG: phage/plasmid primase, P4 family [Sphaerochaeta sp.]|nr:phage/plasmid primase, P4 family [Sphaerochaeta sp.]
MRINLYSADCTGNAKNCHYHTRIDAITEKVFEEAIRFDHVCAEYKDGYRSVGNFLSSATVVMDCDNDHSDNPDDWVSPEHLTEELSDVSFAIATSRNHNQPKEGKGARPRFHAYFPIREITDADTYARLKRAIHSCYPFFDANALDAARFIFGADQGVVIWNEGWMHIDEAIAIPQETTTETNREVIPEGMRNKTLSRFAGKVLKRYGVSDRAHGIFVQEAAKCDPPLQEDELDTIWYSAVRFAQRVHMQDGYVDPETYNAEFSRESLKPSDYSDIGQAKVLAREYGDELKYSDGTDYIRYNGEYWVESRQMALGAAEEFLDLQLEDAIDAVDTSLKDLVGLGYDEGEIISGGKKFEAGLSGEALKAYKCYLAAMAYKAFVMKRRDMKYVMGALQAAKPMVLIEVQDLDRDPFLLNTPGATYDLQQGLSSRRQPCAEDLITKQTTCTPGEKGKDAWNKALDLFFCHDKELIEYVQQIVGIAAIGKVCLEALIIAYGGGSNGKSTFWNSISRVMGSYSGAISADALTAGCKRNIKPEIAELKGKRLVIASELEEGTRLNTSTAKILSSTDEIEAEKKYKDPFKFRPTHTVVLYTNHLPKVGACDAGTWRRLIVIPFNARITGNGDVKNYADHLVEHAGEAIMAWIIEGARKAISRKFHLPVPRCVQQAIDKYRENNDWMGNFLQDCCRIGPDLEQPSGKLYQEYRNYCNRTGEYTRSTTDFYAALESAGFERKKTRMGIFIAGLVLKPEDFLE